jgi:hypothetical protein
MKKKLSPAQQRLCGDRLRELGFTGDGFMRWNATNCRVTLSPWDVEAGYLRLEIELNGNLVEANVRMDAIGGRTAKEIAEDTEETLAIMRAAVAEGVELVATTRRLVALTERFQPRLRPQHRRRQNEEKAEPGATVDGRS